MKLSVPLDYSRPNVLNNDQQLFRELLGVQKIDLSRSQMTGLNAPNLFSDLRFKVLKDLTRLKYLLSSKLSVNRQVFSSLSEVWEIVLKFKDLMAEEETSAELEISKKFNEMGGKTLTPSASGNLQNLISLIEHDFNSVIDHYFPIKGYAKIEFATRAQAERAITLSSTLKINNYQIEAVFDRGLPDYFYNTQLVAEAYIREMSKKEYLGDSRKKYEVKLNHHYEEFCSMFAKNSILMPMLNNTTMADPLVSQQARTKEEASDIVASVSGVDTYGFGRREKKLAQISTNSMVHEFSSEDDFFEERIDNQSPATEKLFDGRTDFARKLNKSFLMFPEKIPVRRSEVDPFSLVPNMEFPKEIPPKKLWSNNGEKTFAFESILNYQQFFHEKLPKKLVNDPSLLQKEKFGDFPNFRYVFEQEYDRLKSIQKRKEKEKRQEIIKNLRQNIRNFSKEEPKLNLVEVGEEEKAIFQKADQRISTDSEEEEAKQNEANKIDTAGLLSEIKSHKEKIDAVRKLIEEIGLPPNLEFSKTVKFEGEDIESFIKDLESKNIQAKWATNELNEKIVQATVTDSVIDYDGVEKIYEKYGAEIESGKLEIDIDEEDKSLLEQLKDYQSNPQLLFEHLLQDLARKEYDKEFERYTSVEDIKKYGQMTPAVQDLKEKIEFLSSVENLTEYYTEKDEEDEDN